jgi:D-alanyl-D-alanine carboxypeptidase
MSFPQQISTMRDPHIIGRHILRRHIYIRTTAKSNSFTADDQGEFEEKRKNPRRHRSSMERSPLMMNNDVRIDTPRQIRLALTN